MKINIPSDSLRSDCIDILSQIANPVAVVTAEVEGRPWGVTVSSFLPVSMDPPKVLVSLFEHTLAAQTIVKEGRFGVSLLDQNSEHVAAALSRPRVPKFMEDFRQPSTERSSAMVLDTPAIAESHHFHCQLVDSLTVGDHVLLIGEVKRADIAENYDVLMYHNRAFASVVPMERTDSSATAGARNAR